MKKKKEPKFYATKKRSKQSLQPEEQGFLTTSIQAKHQPTPCYQSQTSRPSCTKTTKLLIKDKCYRIKLRQPNWLKCQTLQVIGDLVVTLNEECQIIHLFKIIKILNKFKLYLHIIKSENLVTSST